MLRQIAESFFQKVGGKLVNYAHSNVTDITNSKFDVATLEMGLDSLGAIACDVEDKIKKDVSRKKKRKREVEDWLKQVQLIQTDFIELQSRGYITRLLSGGRVAKLNKRVDELIEKSRHFGEVLVDDYDQRGEAFLTAEKFGEAFEENLDIIWRLLVDDRVESIGIYGMGGVGKTTLMKHI